MKAYLAIKYRPDKTNLKIINEISDLLKDGGIDVINLFRDFEKNPEAAKKSIKSDQRNIKAMKVLISAMQKTIKKTNKFLNSWGVQ